MKERVVAYARVSTDHDDQLNSLENQKQHWEEYIKSNPEWEYCGLYWDDESGTSTIKRDGFNKMIEDAENGEFDLIITKQATRWARNVVDALQYTRRLKTKGVGVLFHADNIHTIKDADAELRLSIMATLAQEDSRRISENVKFGHLRAMKNGVVYGGNRLLGYDIKNKKLYINEKEAVIIRDIFNWFVYEKESLHGIVRKLRDKGITKGKTGGKIDHTTIKRILENEKYCGDLKQRKYYTEDFLNQKQKQNNGEIEFIIIKNNHEPIINRETWNTAQEILKQRRVESKRGNGYTKHCWGGKIICPECGNKFRRKVLKNKDGTDRPIWICINYHNNGKKGCENSSYLREDVLNDTFQVVIKKLKQKSNQDRIIKNLNNILGELLEKDNSNEKIEKINKSINKIKNKREKLLELYMESNLTKEVFTEKNDKLNMEEENLLNKKNMIEQAKNKLENQKQDILDLYEVIKNKPDNLKNIDDFVNRHIKEIIKHKDKLSFVLKTGEKIDADLSKYPKRICSRDYITIMDIKVLQLINRGAVQYYEEIGVEVLLVA